MYSVAIAVAFLVAATPSGVVPAHDGARPRPDAIASPALDDATIVAIFDAANSADIETGRLAAERGSAKEVREFGAMLARDHEHVRKLGRDLAKKLGVTPTPPANDQSVKDHAATMKRLRALDGVAFDRAFLQYEAAFHAAVIEAVQKTLLPAIRNDELRALVVKVAPAFEAHRVAALSLEKKLAGGGNPSHHGH